MAFGDHFGIMLMLPVIDEVEKEGLCYTVNSDFIIAHIKLLLLRNVSLEHGREHSAKPISTTSMPCAFSQYVISNNAATVGREL
ncbi:MAG: hypothetical protein K6B13_14120 [Prevotella sp.]|nr:hypothetical protein [Prevotella sp.]